MKHIRQGLSVLLTGLLAIALCRISAHAEEMERRCREEKDQTS